MTETFITLKFIINQTLKQVVSILYSRNSTKKKKKTKIQSRRKELT